MHHVDWAESTFNQVRGNLNVGVRVSFTIVR
jgi:hypothetical protein